jgi:hypothetical protein
VPRAGGGHFAERRARAGSWRSERRIEVGGYHFWTADAGLILGKVTRLSKRISNLRTLATLRPTPPQGVKLDSNASNCSSSRTLDKSSLQQ